MRLQQGLISLVSLLTTSFVPGPICVDALPDVFTAVIAGMDCSLYLVTKGNLVNKKKSSVQCMTKQTVMVQSAIVISDNTDKIFNLTLRAKVKNTKLIRGVLLPVPEDINLASKSIQHQGPADEPVDMEDVVKQLNGSPRVSSTKQGISVNCTYQEPGNIDWSDCQETGIKIKILNLIKKRKECFNYRTMTSKCEGGSRGYHRNEANTTGGNDVQIDNVQPVSPGVIVEGDMIIPPNQKTNRNARLGPVVIRSQGRWGSFPSSPTFCPSGSFVFGYQLRSESAQGGGVWFFGGGGDDTALNAIELHCRRPNHLVIWGFGILRSSSQSWGSWSSRTYCPGTNNPVIGFDVKEEGSQGGGDDTALNDVDLYCKFGGYVSASVNTDWGSWKPKQICPVGYAVMGFRTQVEGNQGGGDDTALNGVELYCKPYPNGS